MQLVSRATPLRDELHEPLARVKLRAIARIVARQVTDIAAESNFTMILVTNFNIRERFRRVTWLEMAHATPVSRWRCKIKLHKKLASCLKQFLNNCRLVYNKVSLTKYSNANFSTSR